MFQNIKADVIYYKTNTDFEMEFNLCGCCRMRLLNSKADDRKTFIADLTRAVSRSKVIIIVGNLFGEDNIISNIAGAISKTLSPADNKAYGIKSDEEINIITGSTPLVSEDGYFGGCIIESGPQTMILLTESRSIKKSVLNTLIHPYLEELYAAETNAENPQETLEEEKEDIIEELVEETEEEIENSEETMQELILGDGEEINDDEISNADNEGVEQDNMENNQEEFFEGMIFEAEEPEEDFDLILDEEELEFFAEAAKITKKDSMNFSESYTAMDVDEFGLIEEEVDPYFNMVKPPIINMPMMIILAIILILVAVLCYSLIYMPIRSGIPASEYINNIVKTLFV